MSYYTLVTSLPHLPYLFANRQLPCSRIQLDRRLGMLQEQDRAQLELMESLLWWDHQGRALHSDEALSHQLRIRLQELQSQPLREFSEWQLELRTLIAALRRRRLEPGESHLGSDWGVGRWSQRIRAKWQEPVFGLEFCFPFASELRHLLEQDQSLAVEKLLLRELWQRLTRLLDGHYFDFEAVALYVMRWHLIERFIHHQREAALSRFDQLTDRVLSDVDGLLLAMESTPGHLSSGQSLQPHTEGLHRDG
ncbi:MAG TPA: hypothetical protein VIS52_05285 [Motiliproteus sp.]